MGRGGRARTLVWDEWKNTNFPTNCDIMLPERLCDKMKLFNVLKLFAPLGCSRYY